MTSGNFSTIVAETLRRSETAPFKASVVVAEVLRSVGIVNPPFNTSLVAAETLRRSTSYNLNFSTVAAETLRRSTSYNLNFSTVVAEVLRLLAAPPAPTGLLFCVDSSGNIFNFSQASGFSKVGTFGTPAIRASIGDDVLYSLLPEAQSLGAWSILANTSAAYTVPMNVPACLAALDQYTAVGGWSYASGASGFSDAANAYSQSQFAGVTPSGASLWNVSGFVWSEAQVLSSSPGSNLAWTPNDDWVLVSDPVNNLFRALEYSLGSLSQTQTIAVSSPGRLSVTPDSAWALVAYSGGVQPIYYDGSSWAASGNVSLAACSAVLALTTTTAVAGCSSGAAFLTLGASGWGIASVSALSYVPLTLATDGSGVIFAAGSGVAQILDGASGAYAGTAVDSMWQQGQFIVADPGGVLRIFGPSGSAYVQQGSIAAPSGTTFVAPIGGVIAAGDASATWLYQLTAPYTAARVRQGVLAVYASGWVSANLAIGSIPETLAWDASGHVAAATSDNMLVTMTAAGSILSTVQVNQFSGQPQTTPIGLSSLLASGGSLYGATCLNDSLVQL